jgi:hypothetical protein
MNYDDLNNIIAETERFLKKAKTLRECTESSIKKKDGHYQKFGHDAGVYKGCQQSKTRAAVKRAAIDLKNVLTLCNKAGE